MPLDGARRPRNALSNRARARPISQDGDRQVGRRGEGADGRRWRREDFANGEGTSKQASASVERALHEHPTTRAPPPTPAAVSPPSASVRPIALLSRFAY